MKRVIFLLIYTLSFLFFRCNKQDDLKSYMVKSWQTTYLKIEMESYHESDSTYVFEDRFENDPPVLAQSTYHSDGTFSAWYLNKQGEKQSESTGSWKTEGDSLKIKYFYNGKEIEVSYLINITNDGFEGISQSDWDGDGERDDLLLMRTKSINLNER